MALRISFFKTPKHRVFNYMPRYYDEQAERREELRKLTGKVQDSEMMSDESITRHLRSRMRQGFQQAIYGNRKQSGNKKMMRFVILISLAALMFSLFYFTKMMELLMTALTK